MPGRVLSDLGAEAGDRRLSDLAPGAASAASARLSGMGLALLGLAIGSGCIEPLLAMTRRVPLDPNEGWNAYFEQLAVHGGVLYPPPGSTIINNYPPLSFYLVGGVGRLVGDNIFAGRAIALLAMLVVSINVFAWLRVSGSARRVALLGSGLFTAFAVTYARPYVAINDPQWLAHALMTTGLLVLWRGPGRSGHIIAGAALMLAAGWTKHLLIPLPLAVSWWLLRRSKAAFVTWVAAAALLLAASGAWVWWLYGTDFFDSLRSARVYSVHQAVKDSTRALKCMAPLVVLSAALLPWVRRNERIEFVAVYVVLAAAVAVAASGGVGVDINAFFDLMIAASMGAALAAEAVWTRRAVNVECGAVLTALLGVYMACYAAAQVPGELREWRGLDGLERDTRAAITLVAARGQGRAACETPELCYWAHAAYTVDFFNYGQRVAVGKQPFAACNTVFVGTAIPLIQMDPNDGRGSKQLPAVCNDVIFRNYQQLMTSQLGTLLVPRP